MREILTLAAEKRDVVGSRASRRLRELGKVPCVIYGHKQDPMAVAIDHEPLEAALRRHTRMVDLEIGGTTDRVLLAEVQHDSFGTGIIHADFIRVAMDEVVRVEVPVILRGSAKAEQRGGIVEQLLTDVEVECLPADIPERIPLVITELEIGESVRVGDLKPPQGVKIVTDGSHLVVTVAAPKKVEEVAEAAPTEPTAAEPEVIGRGKEEEESPEEAKD